jgi:hypothetical protein
LTRYFFATAADLVPLFSRVEAKRELVYTRTGLLQSSPSESFTHGEALPTLRCAPEGRSTVCCGAYLVTPAGVTVQVRKVPQTAGGIRYAVDQLVNPDSVIFNHGGCLEAGLLLAGWVGTCTCTDASEELFQAYASAVAKTFIKIKPYWVGPEARELLEAGWRLTQSADSPAEYDLSP